MFLSCVGLKLRMCGIYQYVLRPVAIEGNIDAKHSCTDLAILISEPGPTAVPDPDRVWTAPDRHSLKQ